ncbi:SDR family NAD(P)-dependent oxidoreductase [Leptolyngbyaceae cyanobacterium CCMR0081]|uniref:SDR family NAD(P)-dependent oxidoreductase n=2 Tax=Adonisia TaxID=2950183 RepID=A0A6M0RFZ1_9CYAN|nr:SDR family NAD(P)-dependent oxidoreductase [Adonisia turfae]NEZ54551.1 SDR family NAD(P)-dependent oxidoreductase [Adonisia turfae CCMR0081]
MRDKKIAVLKSDHPLLMNHVVLTRPILPAVGYFDMIFESMSHVLDPSQLGMFPWKVSNAFWLAPLSVYQRALAVELELDRTPQGFDYRILSGGEQQLIIHASGSLGVRESIEIQRSETIDVEALVGELPNQLDASAVYQTFEDNGIAYGEPFRCIESFYFSECAAVGHLVRPTAVVGHPDCFPGLLDAAIQCVLLLVRQIHPTVAVCVPFSLGEILVHEAPGNQCFCLATLKTEGHNDSHFSFDVQLVSEGGKLLGEMQDLCIRAFFPQKTGKAGGSHHQSDNEQNGEMAIASRLWAVASTFTAEPLEAPLMDLSRQLDWDTRVEFAPYNQIYQEFLNPRSLLSQNRSGANFLVIRLEDFQASVSEAGVSIDSEDNNSLPTGDECYQLPNGMTIANLNPYETRYLYHEIFVEQTYLKNGIVLEEGDVVFDIGANIGMFSMFVAQHCKGARIFACEPSPICFQILEQNLFLHAPGATALPVGVADDDREAPFVFYPKSSVFSGFHADDQEDGHALRQAIINEYSQRFEATDMETLGEHLDGMVDARLQKETYQCQLRSLSSLITEYQIEEIGLLKIDAEKCEWDILSSIAPDDWPKIRQIVVEVHDQENWKLSQRVTALLREKGFELSTVEEDLLKGSLLCNIYGKRTRSAMSARRSALEIGIQRNLEDWVSLLKRAAASRSLPHLVVVCPPSVKALATLSNEFLQTTEAWLRETLSHEDGIDVISMTDQASVYDWGDYHDPVRDAMGHIPYTPRFFTGLASNIVRRLHCRQREPYKVIALDCDNTLWSGIVGETGASDIVVNNDFQILQTFMLAQKQQGMLLCLVSKNDLADVRRVFETRDDMRLKWDDFVACRINWQPKSDNLKSLSESLGLGLESFVFLDDSPIECAEVRAHCPQVLTLQCPAAEKDIPSFLNHVWAFDHARKTIEDGHRTELYKQQARREDFRRQVSSFAEFIESLELDIRITEPCPDDLARMAQLTQRTNQFNFAKRHYSATELRQLSEESTVGSLAVKVADRFGDYGLCGLMVFRSIADCLKIDAFLLSCRVLGRGVEYAMMAALGREAEKRDLGTVEVAFIRTPKNHPAEQFLQELGNPLRRSENNVEVFSFSASELSRLQFVPPEQVPDDMEASVTAVMPATGASPAAFMQRLAEHGGFLEPDESLPVTPNPIIPNIKPGGGDTDAALQRIEDMVTASVRSCLDSPAVAIDRVKPFSEYGVDSMANIKLVVTLNQTFEIVLPPTTLFDYVCVRDLSAYIYHDYPEVVERLRAAESAKAEPTKPLTVSPSGASMDSGGHQRESSADTEQDTQSIAVIGMAGRFPGGRDVRAFWQMLRNGETCITEVPTTRWDINDYYDPNPTKPDKTYGRYGGFLEEIDCFDATFFGISGREARQMDPQQRVFLEESWHALEDAGYAVRSLEGSSNWGVFVGADAGDYQAYLRKAGLPLDASAFMGNDASILAARIAYFMNLKGPALTVDTASSSSLTAVHLACDSLRKGDVSLALAGGVSIHVMPDFHILCSKAGMLSVDGKCKVFDDGADGFVPGESAGVVVLKRLADAIRDGDHVYGVVKGSGMNQDGRTNGITAPSSLSQTQLIQTVYRKLGIDPADIGYVEAHGTGTKLGDPVEIKALTDAFRQFTDQQQCCAIGSVKSNIGHCVHASGVCGLIKLLLSIHHGQIPPSINFSKPNQHIAFDQSPFFVNTQLRDWEPNAQGRRIGVLSSFGFSGTNVHMVVEGAAAELSVPPQPSSVEAAALFVFSAKSAERLQTLMESWRDYLSDGQTLNPDQFQDLAFTLQTGRESMAHRLAIVADDHGELRQRIADFLRNPATPGCFVGVMQGGQHSDQTPGETTIREWFGRQQFDEIAAAWVGGSVIDWSALHVAGRRRRLHGLPGYPFEKDRYWLPETSHQGQEQTSEKSSLNHGQVPSHGISLELPTASRFQPAATTMGQHRLTPLESFAQPREAQLSSSAEVPSRGFFPWHQDGDGVYHIVVGDATPSWASLAQSLEMVASQTDARVVILSADSGFAGPKDRRGPDLFQLLTEFELPIIAAVKGRCRGASCLLVSLCDFMVCAEEAEFQFQPPGEWRLSQREQAFLQERFGPKGDGLLSDQRSFTGIQLKAMGLLLPVVPADRVNAHAASLASELAQAPKEALVQLRRHLAQMLISRAAVPQAAVGGIARANSILLEDLGRSAPLLLQSDVVRAEAYGGGVLLVTLCDRNSRNTFSKAFIAGINEVFALVRDNPRYKVLVLTGYDSYFACGGTQETLLSIQGGTARFTDDKIFSLPLECEIPVIAAMQGHGIGPGWALGMFCDQAIFSEESLYFSPYMQYGFTPGAGATLIFPDRFGWDLGREILFTAREYKGHELRSRGINMDVLPRAQVLGQALQRAGELARQSRHELVRRKAERSRLLRTLLEPNYAQELAMHDKTFVGNQEVQERIRKYYNSGMAVAPSAEKTAVSSAASTHHRRDQVLEFLRRSLADELQLKSERVDSHAAFVDLGLDSITGVTWVRRVNQHYGLSLLAAEVYNHFTLNKFADLVLARTVDQDGGEPAPPAEAPLPVIITPVATAADSDVVNAILKTLQITLAEELLIKPERVNPETPFVDMGLDSISGVTWVRKINQRYGVKITAVEIYSHPTLRQFAEFMARITQAPPTETPQAPSPLLSEALGTAQAPAPLPKPPPKTPVVPPQPVAGIAIIGMAGQFPKAPDLNAFWQNIAQGLDCVTEIPQERWSPADFYNSRDHAPNHPPHKWMGVLEDVDKFDPLFFNISPREAELMDPQQRLFLEASWACIEDAGYDPSSLSGKKCGVFAGCGAGDYGLSLEADGLNAQALMGGAASILPARIAYTLNLHGPCLALDTACSSSLVAMAMACDSLVAGNSDMTLAGGVTVLAGPAMHLMTGNAGMLSANGRCHTFDQRANGFVPGEGVGVLLMKRLEDAERDGDRILGVIRGWGVNQDGRTNGITAPNGDSQTRLQRQVYDRFNIDPATIQYVEAHGTGTKLGDPIEVEGLKQSFRQYTDRRGYCALGAVKSNIGHSLMAAGVAGVIKILQAIRHRHIPPTLHFETLNDQIDLEGSPFYVNSAGQAWVAPPGQTRCAAINSFGFSGTNAHLVIEEYGALTGDLGVSQERLESPAMVVLSARTEEQLQVSGQNLLTYLEQQLDCPDTVVPDLLSIAYTLQTGRQAMDERVGWVVSSLDELMQALRSYLAGETNERARGHAKHGQEVLGCLNTDGDAAEMLRAWARKRKFSHILSLWVRGLDVDWHLFYDQGQPRRVSLPTYPFARQRYWMHKARLLSSDAGSKSVNLPPPLAASLPSSLSSLLIFEPGWTAHPVADHGLSEPPSFHERHVLFCGLDQSLGRECAARLEGVMVHHIPSPVLASDQGTLEAQLGHAALQVFKLIQKLIQGLNSPEKLLLQVVVPHHGGICLHGGLIGILRTARAEYKWLVPQLIELDGQALFSETVARVNDCACHPDDLHIRYHGHDRYIRSWQEIVPTPTEKSFDWQQNGVYLIVGGGGGLGAIFAEEIARNTRSAALILVGRSPMGGDKRAVIERVRSLGAQVEYRQANIADRADADHLIQSVQHAYGGLDGILHCAGVTRDQIIREKKVEDFAAVLAPKLTGTFYLDQASRHLDLDIFLLCSSNAAVLGNPGQVDYATANAFQDVFAEYRSQLVIKGQRTGRTVAIGWPLWKDGGIQTHGAVQAAFKQRYGLTPMPTPWGLRALSQALAAEQPRLLVMCGDPDAMRTSLQMAERGYGQGLDRTSGAPNPEASQIRPQVETILTQIVSDLLKIPTGDLDPSAHLNVYGFDSTLLIELAVRLNTRLGLDLTPAVFFERLTIARIADYIASDYRHALTSLIQSRSNGDQVNNTQANNTQVNNTQANSTQVNGVQANGAQANGAQAQPQCSATVRQDFVAPAEPIAIIGISGSFPMAPDLEAFWHNLNTGQDCITEIPKSRWDWAAWYGDPDHEDNKTNIKWGGFIAGVDEFDPLFFGISRGEAELMDPQQRLLMTHVWKVFEDAGYAAESLSGSATGIFVGTASSGYHTLVEKTGMPIEGHTAIGNLPSVGPNRISHYLNLHGPSEPIETACSSSLVAVHHGVTAIQNGHCEMAVVGGVNTLVTPDVHISMNKAGALAVDGRCKPFSEQANGYVRSEGVGMLLLKPLSAAENDGDHIYGVIRGSAENHGGRAGSLTSPNPRSQADLLKTTYTRAGIDPSTVSYIETHGTGTKLGDPVEINGLITAFNELRETYPLLADGLDVGRQGCGLGSVKSNIGHTELAAGVASVLKVLLQFKHRTLVKSLHAERLNPYIRLQDSPFYVVQENQPWVALRDPQGKELPRRAGVSSFGIGGVNAHVILEAYDGTVRPSSPRVAWPTPMIVLSARNGDRLRDLVQNLLAWVDRSAVASGRAAPSLHGVAYSLQVGRTAMASRLAFVAESFQVMRHKLRHYLQGTGDPGGLFCGEVNGQTYPDVPGPDASQPLVEQCRQSGDYSRLLAHWVNGGTVDWQQCYGDIHPVRVSLPTYPFARDRCWVGVMPQNGHLPLAMEPTPPVAPHDGNLQAFYPGWEALPVPNASGSRRITTTSPLIVGGTPEQIAAIRKQAAATVLTLPVAASPAVVADSIRQQGDVEHLVWIAPSSDLERELGQAMIEAQETGLFQLFNLVKGLLLLGYGDRSLRLTVITTQTQAVYRSDLIQPAHAGVHGLAGTLAQEYPQWQIQALDLPAAWPVQDIFPSTPPTLDAAGTPLAYRDGTWFKPVLLPIRGLDADGNGYRRGGVYVVVGGGGGLGQVWTRWMQEHYQAQVIWLGRRPAAALEQQLNALAKDGLKPAYFQADAAEPGVLEGVLQRIRQRYGRIHGIVHAAMDVFDLALADMTPERFRRVLASRINISVRIAEAVRHQSLDFILFFSSMASFAKAGGYGGYASGCVFMDAYARALNTELPHAVKVVNWGYWGVGSGERVSAQVKRRYQQLGIEPIQPPMGMQGLQTLMQGSLEQMALVNTSRPDAIDGVASAASISRQTDDLPPSLIRNILLQMETHGADEFVSLGHNSRI